MTYKQLIEKLLPHVKEPKLKNSREDLKKSNWIVKSANRQQVDKLTNAVKLEVEKSRLRGQAQQNQEKLPAKGGE